MLCTLGTVLIIPCAWLSNSDKKVPAIRLRSVENPHPSAALRAGFLAQRNAREMGHPAGSENGKSAVKICAIWLGVTEIRRVGLLGSADEADSVAGWVAGDFYFAGGGGALVGVALPLGCGGRVCESGSENLFRYFRVSDYDAAAQGVWEDFDDQAAGILCAESVSDFAGCHCVHVAGVCDFLARAALVPHGGCGVVPGEL